MSQYFFFVYKEKTSDFILVSSHEVECFRTVYRRKYKGKDGSKKARIEAVLKLLDERLPENYTTAQVKNYITGKVYNTPKWGEFQKIYSEIYGMEEAGVEELVFQYKIEVSFSQPINPDDSRIIYLLTRKLLGKTVNNDIIISLKEVL